MKKYTALKGWGRPHPPLQSEAPCTTISGLSCIHLLILGISVVALTPALSCSNLEPETAKEAEVQPRDTKSTLVSIATSPQDKAVIKTLDVLVFSTDRLHRLESYQRFETIDNERIHLASTAGEKLVFACANSPLNEEDWMKVNSTDALDRFCIELESESSEAPSMSGSFSMTAGEESGTRIELRRLTSEIILNSIRCDFRGKPYEGEPLKDARAYLINVNTRCCMFGNGTSAPDRFINVGVLNKDEISMFAEPELLMRELPSEIKEDPTYPDIRLVCCPYGGTEEGPGTPFTRLVIEGKIQGETYYWAATVNQEEDGNGIGRADRYIYNLLIRRKGSQDPDSPASIEEIGFTYSESRWEEKEPYTISF